jgi:hypothetical protein
VIVETAELVEGDSGISDLTGEFDSASADAGAVATCAADGDEEEDVACWLELLFCEVTELAARDMNNLEMRFMARSASSLSLIRIINTSKRPEARDSDASGRFAPGVKKLEMRRRAKATCSWSSSTRSNATRMSSRAAMLANVRLFWYCGIECRV